MDWEDFLVPNQDDETLFQQIDQDLDLAMALSLQEQLNEDTQGTTKQGGSLHSSKSIPKPVNLVDSEWELIDPNPDVHALFLEYNKKFFYGKLNAVEVRWSPRMTLCAGVCCYEGRGRLCSVRLSLPLLKLRPRKDLIETLLHEMIHAYLFVTENNKDRDGHGPEFLSHMHRINKEAGTKISVYHSFHDEVDSYRTHWWKCNGPCQKKRPFYGIVKRAMNRAPGPRDTWWAQHQVTCGGTYTKIKEPDDYKQKSLKRKQVKEVKDSKQPLGIKNFFEPSTSKTSSFTSSNAPKKHKGDDMHAVKSIFAQEDNLISLLGGNAVATAALPLKEKNGPVPFAGRGFELGSTSTEAPKSFLAQLRKDLGYPKNSQTTHLISSEKTETIQLNSSTPEVMKSPSTVINGSSSQHTASSSMNVSEKSKLVQSSLQKFVSSPLNKVVKKEDSTSLSAALQEGSSDMVKCPVCSSLLPNVDINIHLDQCLMATV